MKKKKYLACLLAMSMMLASVSPMAVSADTQDVQADVTFEDELNSDAEDSNEISFLEDEDTVEASADEDTDENLSEYNNVDTDLFSSGEDFIADADDSDTNEEWKTLTSIKKEERILYKYDENAKTLYFKCTEPIAMPDYKLGNRTDWFVDLGSEKISQIKKIVIGDGITGIGNFCFQSKTKTDVYASLEEVELADTVTSIGRGAFGADPSLKKVNLNHVSSVGMAAFADCALEEVTFDSDVVSIDTNAFSGCSSLTSVKSKEISSLGESAFEDCTSLKSFEYEGTIEEISESAFASTGLTTFRFGNVESIGFMAFWNSALKSGCYEGTREGWYNLVGDDDDYANVSIHCKGDAVEAKDATCTEAGWKEVGVCEVCGEHYSYPTDENAIPATGHTWSEDYVVDKEATCTEAGEKSKHCTICDAKEDVQEIPALGHDFVSKVTKKATWTADGTLT